MTNPFLPRSLLFLLVIISIILINFPMTTMSDNPCGYPCNPAPTTPTPVTTAPPPPATTTTYSPPVGYPNNNNPNGYYPYNPPPSTFYGYGPPPPDPILPYFPFYYKHGVHGDSSWATSSHLTIIATATNLLLVVLMFLLSF